MIGVALKGLLGRKLRAALTAVAIILGVAMVSGTFVLTDTIKAAFNTVFTQVYKSTDAVITGKSAIGGNQNQNVVVPSLPQSLLAKVRNLPGVLEAEGGVADTAHLISHSGKVISVGGRARSRSTRRPRPTNTSKSATPSACSPGVPRSRSGSSASCASAASRHSAARR